MPNDKHEDFICWLNVLKKYGIVGYGISECLAYYRVGKKSVSSNKFKSAYWTWNVYRTSQRLSIVQSIYYMFFYIKSFFANLVFLIIPRLLHNHLEL